ncbi:MAG: glutamate--tRNA ligase [Aaplasma endosymbiont of Hyalomma asiaticum]
MSVVTRFAPSPTGSLHLGGARTALFNWLFAKRNNGSFLLRIEDTDKQRSSDAVAQSIMSDLSWLGLNHDGNVIVQSERVSRHVEIAHRLLESGKAYRCYCSEDEVSAQKTAQENTGKPYRHLCPWKELQNSKSMSSAPYVVRLIIPDTDVIEFTDGVYGKISVKSEQLDDMVILRSDGTPTYLLAVVVDDCDMGVTHVIRGSDHITNTTKQIILSASLGWDSPKFFHIPLIHDENGMKLSKRNRAPGIHEYRKLGFLPEAICNYLLRMGWSYKDKEIVTMEEAIGIFSMSDVGLSRSCLDNKKLLFLNHHYMCSKSSSELTNLLLPVLEKKLGFSVPHEKHARLLLGVGKLSERAKTLDNLAEDALFYVQDIPISIDEEASSTIADSKELLQSLVNLTWNLDPDCWKKKQISIYIKEFAKTKGFALSSVYGVLRATMTGRLCSPNVSEIMEILGKEECIGRMLIHLG